MNRNAHQKAIIYCRVSDVKQTTRGDGLSSQETRCREYARHRGYDVVEVFKDDMSGSLVNRPGMKAMLAFLKKHKKAPHVVVIDDISRLARSVDAHLQLRAAISTAGGILESPSVEFGDDADSELQEFILATVAQHQRKKNAEQTKNRMRSRALNGYWVYQAPIGYRFKLVSGRGKMLVRDEPLASIIREALEGYASGRFQAQAEVKRFLEAHECFPVCRHGDVLNQRITNILTQPLYAGMLELPRWDVSLRKAQHEGLISFETFQTIQERLNGKARAPSRADLNADFPLRGFITCGDCGKPLTANWSKGEFNRYPYYLCRTKGCVSTGKSIPRSKVEGAFEALLKSLVPSPQLYSLVAAVFRDLWDQRLAASGDQRRTMKAELSQIDRKIEQLLDRIVDAESGAVVKAYEKRAQDFEARKLLLNERIASCGTELRGYDETFRTAMGFLANPYNLWVSDRLEDKRAVLRLAFADNLAYQRGEGLRTPEIALPFKALGDFQGQKEEMARPERFERPTLRFVV